MYTSLLTDLGNQGFKESARPAGLNHLPCEEERLEQSALHESNECSCYDVLKPSVQAMWI